MPTGTHKYWTAWWMVALLVSGAAAGSSPAQTVLEPSEPLWREPLLGRSLYPLVALDPAPANTPAAPGAPRVRLFHMPSGFLYEPLGLDAGDDNLPADTPGLSLQGSDTGPVQVTMGLDNPFFDYRWRNDPGGIGYYKVHSQLQLLGESKTCLSLGLQAVTPAGLETGGIADGPTVFSPTLAWFQELGGGTALQGFVSKNIRARSGWSDDLENGLHYGMAVQCPIPGLCPCPQYGMHFFIEAIGRYRYEGENAPGKPMSWEIIPGIHWRVGEKWWLSVGAAKTNVITCSWRF
jgi:hypothetical protein